MTSEKLQEKRKSKKDWKKIFLSFEMILKFMILCLIVAISGLIFVSSKLNAFYESSYSNVVLAHSSYGNLQEGAKNLLHACLISDPEIVESKLALADTCFGKMKQELSSLRSTSFAEESVFDAMDADIEVIDTLMIQFQEFIRQNNIEDAFIVYSRQMFSYFTDISANITKIVEAENTASMYYASNMTKYIRVMILVSIGVFSLLIGEGVSILMSDTPNGSISELQTASAQMSFEKCGVNINNISKDEFANLTDSMRHISDTILAVIFNTGRRLNDMTEEDSTVYTEIDESNVDIYAILKNAADQTGAIARMVVTVENMTIMTTINAAKIQKATQSPFHYNEVVQSLLQEGKGYFLATGNNDLAYTKWMCKYHIVFTPKYRRRIIYNQLKSDIRDILKQLCSYKGVEIIEGYLMPDHIHMLVSIPPKMSVSSFMEYLKRKSALMISDRHADLKYKFGSRHFWSEGYYVSTVGLNETTIKKYMLDFYTFPFPNF